MAPERVISIAISEADWKTLRTIQPQPVDWLKDKIRETVDQARQAAGEPRGAAEPLSASSITTDMPGRARAGAL